MAEQIEATANFGHRPRRLVTNWGTWEVDIPKDAPRLITLRLSRDDQGVITPEALDEDGQTIDATFTRLDGEEGVQ